MRHSDRFHTIDRSVVVTDLFSVTLDASTLDLFVLVGGAVE